MTLETSEDQRMRSVVIAFAEHTFEQQLADWILLRERAATADDPLDRRTARMAIKGKKPPTYERCLQMSIRIHRKREIDHRETLG